MGKTLLYLLCEDPDCFYCSRTIHSISKHGPEWEHATQCTEPEGPGCRCNQPVVAVSLADSDSAHCIDHVQDKPMPLPERSGWRDPFGVAYEF